MEFGKHYSIIYGKIKMPLEKINARPTKEFFISMLIKDIGLMRAIIDLIDNSVDGARRIKPNCNYDGLWIKINITKEKFSIQDNCGGITVDIAKNYAFRFGRPIDYELTPKSVGQFGVGMKRTFFKLGNRFYVESRTQNENFIIDCDVTSWKQKEEWEFEFKKVEKGIKEVSIDQCGTLIQVTELHKNVVDDFSIESFKSILIKEIGRAHLDSLHKGLSISVNNIPLMYEPLSLLSSQDIITSAKDFSLQPKELQQINVKIFCGISYPVPSDAGWYIFCNGRMILEADKSEITGWNGRSGKKTPQYHNDFARFRGYVFFESDNASLLPWNTTKTGVDIDSPIYRSIRLEMVNSMKPVLEFLRKLSEEKKTNPKGPMNIFIETANLTSLQEIRFVDEIFSVTKYELTKTSGLGKIQYSKPIEEIRRIQKMLEINTMKEVGEKTFEYFIKMHED